VPAFYGALMSVKLLPESCMKKETIMIAKILIKRKFLKGKSEQIMSIMNNMRTSAMAQPGYISGETLMDHKDPHNKAVLCAWQSLEDWLNWKEKPERKQFEVMLEVFQLGPTEYEEYVVGTSFEGQ
jgi:heme-degrading monooxygenase HmoA